MKKTIFITASLLLIAAIAFVDVNASLKEDHGGPLGGLAIVFLVIPLFLAWLFLFLAAIPAIVGATAGRTSKPSAVLTSIVAGVSMVYCLIMRSGLLLYFLPLFIVYILLLLLPVFAQSIFPGGNSPEK